jgi:NAD(P)-dependent dehydrogenase (short-subunit alcohol dehydrogenase family)
VKHIIVTGGDQGIGKAIVDQMASTHRVTILSGARIKSAANIGSLKSLADNFIAGFFNMNAIEDTDELYLVNNYGINHLSWIGETPINDSLIMDINVMFPYWMVNAIAAKEFKAVVLNISSQTYRVPQTTTSLYCASKAALSHMTKVMARELAPKGWVVNSLAPGKIVGTDMARLTDIQVNELRGWTQEEADGYAKSLIPSRRFSTTLECALTVRKILEMPSYVNGTTIDMTGGV